MHDGRLLGALPPVELAMPWWPEAADLVEAVRSRDGLESTGLRLIDCEPGRVYGGAISYLAEVESPPPPGALRRWSPVSADHPAEDPLANQPLRQSWARPGGPRELLAWADERLLANGLRRTGPAEQRRTWNLSALWRIPTSEGRIWLKTVPAFFAHEGAVIDWIGEPIAPRLIDFAPGRALISDIPGEPNHDVTDPAELRPMVTLLTNLQHRALDRTDELLALGVPDKRLRTMVGRIPSVVEEWGRDLQPGERTDLDHLLSGLPARLDAIGACGVPDTLVHGDFHPGNVAGTPGAYVILDWGDSFLGHPLIDELAFVRRLDGPLQAVARSWFVAAWQRIVPGADPAEAARLLEPVLPLLAAVMYADFCAAIEPSERPYHASDAVAMLRDAAAAGAATA